MSFSIESFFGSVLTAATKLLTLTAAVEQSIHQLEATDPLVQDAINLALAESSAFPPVVEGLAIAKAVLGVATTIAAVTAATSANLKAASGAQAALVAPAAVVTPGVVTKPQPN